MDLAVVSAGEAAAEYPAHRTQSKAAGQTDTIPARTRRTAPAPLDLALESVLELELGLSLELRLVMGLAGTVDERLVRANTGRCGWRRDNSELYDGRSVPFECVHCAYAVSFGVEDEFVH